MIDEKRIRYLLDECSGSLENLSDWEQNFVESVYDQFTRKGVISEKQLEVLERIYGNLT